MSAKGLVALATVSIFSFWFANSADGSVKPRSVLSFYSEVISYPENESRSGISVFETVMTMSEIESHFKTDVARNANGFSWDFHWEKPWLGAGSAITEDGAFQIMLWGGIVRAEKMTVPALELILCHEFGHLLAGTPKQVFPQEGEHWSSTEGQSDWWAATMCLPQVYRSRGLTALEIRDRIRQGALDFSRFVHFHFEKSAPEPSLELSALETPTETLKLAYPSLQCRLDTYRIGAEAVFNETPPSRPRCWFAD